MEQEDGMIFLAYTWRVLWAFFILIKPGMGNRQAVTDPL
jgi:hypothetical protein